MSLLPKEVDQATLAFPANVIGTLLPKWEEIPKEFKDGNKWTQLAQHIFFYGGKGIEFLVKDGVDQAKANRHIMACLRSFEPKHEHKEAGVGYLLSEFFADFELPKE